MEDLLNQEEFYPELAKKRYRYLAAIVDYLIVWGFSIFIGIMFGETYITAEGNRDFQFDELNPLYGTLFWLVIMPITEGSTGQTIGKMIFGLKVVSHDYTDTSIGKSIVRHLCDIIDYFPFFGIVGLIVASNNKNNQRVGDLIAKTIVVKK